VEQALQGKTSGVSIAQQSGSPGAGLTVRIRGTGSNYDASPLFIVDGMRTGGIDYLNPNDIESIEVLKDAASSAIYGAEGANGVVLITTKKGTRGSTQINYDFYYGSQQAANQIDFLNSEEYISYRKEAQELEWAARLRRPVDDPLVQQRVNTAVPYDADTVGMGTDWIDQILQTAPVKNHHLSFSGSNDRGSYFASAAYYDQDGIIGGEKANYKRISSRFNGEYQIKDWFRVESRISYTRKTRKDIDENSEFGGIVASAMNIDPLTPVLFNDSTELSPAALANIDRLAMKGDQYYGISDLVFNEIGNPLARMSDYNRGWSEDKILASFKGVLSPLQGLEFHTKFDIDLAYGTYDNWTRDYWYHGLLEQNYSQVSKEINHWFTYQWENWFTYSRSLEDHHFSLLGGSSYRNNTWENVYASRRGLLEYSDNFALIGAATDVDETQGTGGWRSEGALISYYARLAYNFQEKYLFTFNFRSDGSSKFGPDNKFGHFPSFSAGWVVSRENFWNLTPVNFLKIRASWGQNGSLSNLGDFQYVSTISTGTSYPDGTGSFQVGAVPGSVSNDALKWETSEQLDIGLDLRMVESRITLSMDYYQKITRDLLSQSTIPWLVGNLSPWINAGDILNTGIEFDLGFRNNSGDFSYGINANASYLHNEVLSLSDDLIELQGSRVGPSNTVTKFEEGMPVWYFWG
jgi:TonB-linked SusC/RagA family outer membrane protein